ncbi:MAG: DUF4321 domain-containing protein [Oscillospiraceae bacterium]|nr:DUF4321 domain-containing protein [Oscillospiraceae bacterium]
MKLKITILFCIIFGALAGYYLGALCAGSDIAYLAWLGKSLNFGFDTINVDLNMMKLSFGLHMDINFIQIFLTVLLVALSPKIAASIKTK